MSVTLCDLYHATEEDHAKDGVCVRTDATSPDEFVKAFAKAMYLNFAAYNRPPNEPLPAKEHRSPELFAEWMVQGFEIMAKLKGYKSERVHERRILWAGDTPPYHGWHIGNNGEQDDESGYE